MSHETAEATPSTKGAVSPGFVEEFQSCWQALSSKGFFFGLLLAWLALFYFLGSSTLGYVNTSSLFGWLNDIYSAPQGDDGHGILIPFAVAILFWWKRKELLIIPQRTWWPAIFIVAVALGFHWIGYVIQQPRVSVVAMFLGGYGLIGLAWGPRWLKATFFPYVLFIFCMPVGGYVETVTMPLRTLATNITHVITHDIFGFTLIKRGTQLLDAKGAYSYDVAAACSGIRSLISLLALTTIYAMITFKTKWKRLFVISMAVPLAVGCNVLRLTGIVVGAEAFGQKTGDFIHEWSGFLTYVVAITAMLLLGHWLRERDVKPTLAEEQPT